MASFLILAGRLPKSLLPVVMFSYNTGLTKPVDRIDIFRICTEADDPVIPQTVEDLGLLSDAAVPGDPYWQTYFDYRSWQPDLKSISNSDGQKDSVRLLTDALYGQEAEGNIPDDTASVRWRMTSLLHAGSEQWLAFSSSVRQLISNTDEPVRVMIAADLADPEGSGIAFSVASFLRKSFPEEERLTVCFSFLNNITGIDDPALRQRIRDNLRTATEICPVRVSSGTETPVADGIFMFGLPAACRVADPEGSPVSVAFARVSADFFTSADPVPAFRTVSIPGTLTWSALGRSAPRFAAFIRMAVWLLSDLIPSIESINNRSTVMTVLSPSPRTVFIRKFFQPAMQEESAFSGQLSTLVRILKQILTHVCAFVRFLPDCLRLNDRNSEDWAALVSACGQSVTIGSSWDVSMKSAVEAGLDKIKPVHRVSLADTEEEKAQRDLKDQKTKLDRSLDKRREVMEHAGGFRSAQALADCLARCEKALAASKAQLNNLREDDREKTLLAQSRINTLKAAVDRTREDLRHATVFPAISAFPSPRISLTSPWAGELFDPDGIRLLFDFLTASPEADGEMTRNLRDSLSTLIRVQGETDLKLIMKQFSASCHDADLQPFAALLTAASVVFTEQTVLAPAAPAGDLPPVTLIPDTDLSERITTAEDMAFHLTAPVSVDQTASARGLLAMLLLIQYRRGSADSVRLTRRTLRPADGPDITSWLDTVSSSSAEIISMRKGADEFPIALILPGSRMFAVPLSVRQASMIPGFVLWFSPLTRAFSDPCAYLNESDRILLTEQLTRVRSLLDPVRSSSLNEFLGSFHRALMNTGRRQNGSDASFRTRLTAVCGLAGLPAYRDLVRHVVIYEKDIEDDMVCSCLSGTDRVSGPLSKVDNEINYSWRGIPFARESSTRLLETLGFPDEDQALIPLKEDCDLLFAASDTYRDELQKNIPLLLKKYPSCTEEYKNKAIAEMNLAASPIEEHVTGLDAPVDPDSAALGSILSEGLAPLDPAPFMDPFSKKLAVVPRQGRQILGDSLLSEQCILKSGDSDTSDREIPDDAVIPPFSAGFASMLCETSEGRTLMGPDLLSFSREGDSIRVSILLHASFDLRLTHVYGPDDIIYLYSDDIPTVAVWPAIPFGKNDWKAYFSFGHMPGAFTVSALLDGKLLPMPHDGERYAQKTEVCPTCFILEKDGISVGALPNILPGPAVPDAGGMTACIDYGSSGISVVLCTEAGPEPLSGSVTVRTLLKHPVHSPRILRDEFMPAVPVTPILPSATRIFRNVPNQAPVPFNDGSILMPSSLEDLTSLDPATLFSSLKWTTEKSRSSELCLHQVMLMTALQARLNGASTLSWRLAIPDEMAFDGKQMLAQHFSFLVETVSAESCLLPPSDTPMVSFASESTANGAYFRACVPEQTGAGFMVLDIGSCSSDLSLFLRGHNDPVRACRLPLGIQYMMIPALLSEPRMLSNDFYMIQDESFQRDLSVITDLFTAAQKDKTVLRKARLALDTFVADRLGLIRQYLMTVPGGCSSTGSGAMLLVHHAWLMTLSGLLLFQLSSDSTRNDSIPSRMNLFLSGRGSGLMESMSAQTQARLSHFLSLCRNNRVQAVQVRWSTEKKLEIPVGLALQEDLTGTLPRPAISPVAIPVKPAELISRFLLMFLQEFPNAALTVFPGWYSNDPYLPLSGKAVAVIESAVSACFSGKDIPRPFDSLAACLTFLLESARS